MEDQFKLKMPNWIFTTENSVAHEPTNLTLDKLLAVAKELKRENWFYVIGCDHIPDDAHGILFVRSEDADKWHTLKDEDHKETK